MKGSLSVCRRWFSASTKFMFISGTYLLLLMTVVGVFRWTIVVAVPVCAAVWRDTAQEGAEDPARCFQTMTPSFSMALVFNSATWTFSLAFSPRRGAGLRAFSGAFLENDQQEPIFSTKKNKSFFCRTETLGFYFSLERCSWCWVGDLCTTFLWLSWSQGGISEDFLFVKRTDLWFSLWGFSSLSLPQPRGSVRFVW